MEGGLTLTRICLTLCSVTTTTAALMQLALGFVLRERPVVALASVAAAVVPTVPLSLSLCLPLPFPVPLFF
jgi:hypothetical protein